MFPVKDTSDGEIKYTGRSKAKVLDTRDPLKRGRIIVDHPLLGDTVWIDYVGEPNMFNPPKIGDLVYVEADSGWYTHPIAHGRAIKGPDTQPEIPESFRRLVPTNRGLHTPGGHKVELDDGEAPITDNPQDTNFTTKNRGIRVTSTGGNKVHIIEDVDSGDTYILIQDAGGNLIKLDYKNNQLTINSIGKTKIDTATDKDETVGGNETQAVTGNRTKNVDGNETDTIGGNLQITITGNADILATGATTIKGSNITLKSPANSINGGVVTDNTANNDPITGIPLTPVGGVVTSS
jgi:hypothetical protein